MSKTVSTLRNKLQNLLKKQIKKDAKQLKVKLEIEEYEAYMERIQSLHKECSATINWAEIKNTPAPFEKGEKGPREQKAVAALENYQPSFFVKLFFLEKRQRNKLELRVEEAKRIDQEEYSAWEQKVTFAAEVLNHNEVAYNHVLMKYTSLKEIKDLGSQLDFELLAPETLKISFHVNENTVIPSEVKSLSPTGRLSIRQMSVGKFNGAYQDYVCSAALRMAREAFAVLPIHTLYLHAHETELDTSTGYERIEPILSVKFDRATLQGLNFDLVDPSDSMQNFEHNMKLMKTKGFQVVEKVKYEEQGKQIK